MFQVGQKCECIEGAGRWYGESGPVDGPSIGDVLTVSGKQPFDGEVLLRFYGQPAAYHTNYFRPLTEDPKAVKRTMEEHFNKYLRQGERV